MHADTDESALSCRWRSEYAIYNTSDNDTDYSPHKKNHVRHENQLGDVYMSRIVKAYWKLLYNVFLEKNF